MSTTVWTVTGMTCGHCVKAVTEEVAALPGVTGVDVDLESGRVTVTADADPDTGAEHRPGQRVAPGEGGDGDWRPRRRECGRVRVLPRQGRGGRPPGPTLHPG